MTVEEKLRRAIAELTILEKDPLFKKECGEVIELLQEVGEDIHDEHLLALEETKRLALLDVEDY